MKFQPEYVLYTACYVAAFNTDEIDLDDLGAVREKHSGCYAMLLGLHHGKQIIAPLSPSAFEEIIRRESGGDAVAAEGPQAHPAGDGPRPPDVDPQH